MQYLTTGLSAIVGGCGPADNCVRERKTKTLVLGPLRFLLVIREWLSLRNLVQDGHVSFSSSSRLTQGRHLRFPKFRVPCHCYSGDLAASLA